MTLRIAGVDYLVRFVPAPALGASARAIRLRRAGGDVAYHVASTQHGPTCECADFTFRRDGLDPAGCKHIRACRALGLLR